MDILHGIEDHPERAHASVLAIGNFDGVHRGHQALLAVAKAKAMDTGTLAGVMIFEPHPREFFHPEETHFRLTPLDEKVRIFESLDLDFVAVITFDTTLANLSADAFCKDILGGKLNVAHVVIGYDFFFGKGRSGSPETLKAAGAASGFQTSIIAPVAEDGEVFSSTAIRLKLAQGDVKSAAHALGRWWQVRGPVIGGAHRGTDLGFPTANIPMPRGTAISHGIYAVRVTAGDTELNGAAYLGTRPTFDDGKPVLEV
ncbi:MAG: riboflavin biosynthesis protein RibF, partial [Alphaproteobacteria bacterium]|nr:riboflavin biosynthesis protein RibF [Alphaproteobacteria bacterium]